MSDPRIKTALERQLHATRTPAEGTGASIADATWVSIGVLDAQCKAAESGIVGLHQFMCRGSHTVTVCYIDISHTHMS